MRGRDPLDHEKGQRMATQSSWASEVLAVNRPRLFEVEDTRAAGVGLADEHSGERLPNIVGTETGSAGEASKRFKGHLFQ